MIYKTRGIIIRRQNFGEADRLITVFTQDRGKVRVIAKGARKPLSKLAGHLELFCLTKLNLAEGHSLDVVTGAVIEKCFLGIRQKLPAAHTAYYLAETVDQLTVENEKHEEIFELLDEAFEHINVLSAPLLLSYFELNLAKITGFRPELYTCLVCKQKIVPDGNYFDFAKGGLVCGHCNGRIGQAISNEAIKILRLLLDHSINIITKIKTENKIVKEVKSLTADYLVFIHQKEFKSRRFVK